MYASLNASKCARTLTRTSRHERQMANSSHLKLVKALLDGRHPSNTVYKASRFPSSIDDAMTFCGKQP